MRTHRNCRPAVAFGVFLLIQASSTRPPLVRVFSPSSPSQECPNAVRNVRRRSRAASDVLAQKALQHPRSANPHNGTQPMWTVGTFSQRSAHRTFRWRRISVRPRRPSLSCQTGPSSRRLGRDRSTSRPVVGESGVRARLLVCSFARLLVCSFGSCSLTVQSPFHFAEIDEGDRLTWRALQAPRRADPAAWLSRGKHRGRQ